MGFDPEYFFDGNGLGDDGGGVAESLLCPVCQCVYDTPMVIDPCGHSFCKECVVSLLDSGHENCPVCRTKMIEGEGVGVPPNRALKELISNMKIRCMNCAVTVRTSDDDNTTDKENENKNDCCSWTGKLMEFEGHADRDCPMQVVTCPITGCDFEGPRRLLNQHNLDSVTVHTDLLVTAKLEQIKKELLGVTATVTRGIGSTDITTSGIDDPNAIVEKLGQKLEEKDREINALKARLLDNWFSSFFTDWILAKPPYFHNFVVYRPIKYLTGSISQIIVGVPGPSNSDWEGGLYPLLITITPEGFERKEPPKCDFPENFFHPNVYEGNVRVNTLLEFEGSWDPSISLQEILFCIQQLLTHPNHCGFTLYDPEEYRESILRQAEKYNLTGTDFLERAMVELQSKIDADYKMPLESWENERWQNLEEVRWKGRRSYQSKCGLVFHPRSSANGLTRMGSPEEEAQFVETHNGSASVPTSPTNHESNNENINDGAGVEAESSASVPEVLTTDGRSVLAPIANTNSTDLSPSRRILIESGRIRNNDGKICECSCCEQGSTSFIDREHRMRYLFAEGG